MNHRAQEIALIGAGIVNLISAYFLSENGYRVKVFDRSSSPLSPETWQQKGATHGGMNARMYSLTEADNYNEKSSKIYADMTHVFEQCIGDNGWRVKKHLEEAEKEWIDAFKSVDPQFAREFAEDIYQINIQSGGVWKRLMDKAPDLLEGVNVRHDIVRVYSREADFQAAQCLHRRLGSLIEVVEEADLPSYLPCFKHARQEKQLGGVMKVQGFTLQIHDFCKNLIALLEDQGVEFFWEKTMQELIKNDKGELSGIRIDGDILQSDHTVISLGAYPGKIFDHVGSRNKIHGVLGAWLTLPDIYGLSHSFKIHKDGHIGEDSNVTLVEEGGHKKLVIGSGYGYVGKVEANTVSTDELHPIFDSMVDTARLYFREAYEQALSDGSLYDNWKYCTRPFTSNGLGIFEVINQTNGGQTIITGGHNTGGFTQAPLIARSILDQLSGKQPSMARLYHPNRKNLKNVLVNH